VYGFGHEPFGKPQASPIELAREDLVFARLRGFEQLGDVDRIAVWLWVLST
jgi:hypothetical protein